MDDSESQETRHLEQTPSANYLEERDTGPLDVGLPWVVEFRVPGTGSTLQKRLSDVMVLGRQDPEHNVYPEIDLTPYHAYTHGVSRRHAVIQVRQQRITIKDLDSTNGTKLNDFDLLPGTEYRLRHGDELMLGQLKLQLFFAVVPARQDDDESLGPEHVPVVGQGQRVLVIENNADVGAIFRGALEQAGFKTQVVDSALTAITHLGEQIPAAMIFDLAVSDMNGLDFVRYVRKNVPDRRVPVIVISGPANDVQTSKALEAGANAVIEKPVAIDELVTRVAEVIRHAQPPV